MKILLLLTAMTLSSTVHAEPGLSSSGGGVYHFEARGITEPEAQSALQSQADTSCEGIGGDHSYTGVQIPASYASRFSVNHWDVSADFKCVSDGE